MHLFVAKIDMKLQQSQYKGEYATEQSLFGTKLSGHCTVSTVTLDSPPKCVFFLLKTIATLARKSRKLDTNE